MADSNILFNSSFWNDTNVIEKFSPEDRYFYLWCLTNPHNNILGCFEISRKTIARELGYNSDDNKIINTLLERFENSYNRIKYNYETNEILILNWYKYNWNSSPTVARMIDKALKKVKDDYFVNYLLEKIEEKDVDIDTAYSEKIAIIQQQKKNKQTGCQQGVNTPISKSNSISINKIEEYFNYIWDFYPKKEAKQQAISTFEHKFRGLNEAEAKGKANIIFAHLKQFNTKWDNENTEYKYIPLFSSWLNKEIEDSKHFKGNKRGVK